MTTLVQTTRSPPRRGRKAQPRARPRTLGVLTLNIGAAGAERAAAILQWLRRRPEDVLVLTETSGGPGTTLLGEGLRADGFTLSHRFDARERGVLVASKAQVSRDVTDQLSVTLPCRAGAVLLDAGAGKIALVGVYIPSRDRSDAKIERKESFIASLLDGLRGLPKAQRDRLVLAGDYNAIARRHEPRLSGFFPWEYGFHDELERIGLSPAHEICPGRGHPHSWIGRTGLRYLYDYVHVGRGLQAGVERCEYLHAPRERRLSDHAAVAVQLRVA